MLAATAKDYIEATGWVGSDLVVQNNRPDQREGGGRGSQDLYRETPGLALGTPETPLAAPGSLLITLLAFFVPNAPSLQKHV